MSTSVAELRLVFPTTRSKLAMCTIIFQSLFSGLYWGFTSFQASLLHTAFDVSYNWLTIMIPVSTVSYIATLLYIGLYGHRHTHKSMYLFSCILGILHALLVVRGVLAYHPWNMAVGYFLGGASYAIIDLLPVVDARRFADRGSSVTLYHILYLTVSIADALSLALGRLLMVLALMYGPALPISWVIPWGTEIIGLCLCLWLIWVSEYPEARNTELHTGPTKNLNIKGLLEVLWGSRTFKWFSLGYAFCAFSFGATTAWYPVIVDRVFAHEDAAYRVWIFLVCSAPCMVAAALGTSALLRRTEDARQAIGLVGGSMAIAAACAFGLLLLTNSILGFAVVLSLFVSTHYFPHFVLKTLPRSFKLDGEVNTLAIAILTIIYAFFGNALGVLAVGFLIAGVPILWSLAAIATTSTVAAVLFFLPLSHEPRGQVESTTSRHKRTWETRSG